MPNLMNRRKKKNKIPAEVIADDESDSDSSSSYDFSSSLNRKYNQNVLPGDIERSQKVTLEDVKGLDRTEDCKLIRFLLMDSFV